MTRESLAAKVIETGGKLTVRSALNPILWLCAIITIPSLCIASFKTETPDWLIFLIIAPVCVAIVGFLFLLFIDRDKLQSEEYQLKKKSLELSRSTKYSHKNYTACCANVSDFAPVFFQITALI